MENEKEKQIILNFKKEKETKNTIRYQEIKVNDKFNIGPIYFQKSYLGSNPPQEIKIIIPDLKN